MAEFLQLTDAVEEQSEIARCAYMHNCISDILDNNKNFWKELHHLGLIPKSSNALHGFLPEELNEHFSNISISNLENPAESYNNILTAPSEGFVFKSVTSNDVILSVKHFNSQAKEKMAYLKA